MIVFLKEEGGGEMGELRVHPTSKTVLCKMEARLKHVRVSYSTGFLVFLHVNQFFFFFASELSGGSLFKRELLVGQE